MEIVGTFPEERETERERGPRLRAKPHESRSSRISPRPQARMGPRSSPDLADTTVSESLRVASALFAGVSVLLRISFVGVTASSKEKHGSL